MNARNLTRSLLSVVLVLLSVGMGLTDSPRPRQPTEVIGADIGTTASYEWLISETDTVGDTGQHVSVAYNEELRRLYISYYDATEGDLRQARPSALPGLGNCGPDNSLVCKTVDSEEDVGQYSSIAVNPATGGVGIAYHDATNGKLKYVYYKNPYLWTHSKNTIDRGIYPVSSTGLYASLAFSPSGTPSIAYQFANSGGVDALMVASYVGSGGNCGEEYAADEWQCDTVLTGEGVGQHASLGVDANGGLHIAHYDASNSDLLYATSTSSANCGPANSWACYPLAVSNDVGKYASLYVDSANLFHIAYYDATNDKLMYANQRLDSGGNCGVLGSAQCDEIDNMQADYHPLGVSIAEDANGYPMIAYQAANGSLKLARPVAALGLPGAGNCGPQSPFSTWYCETVHQHGTWIHYRNGDFASVALDSWGLAIIAHNGFITASGGNLYVARQQPKATYLPLLLRGQ